MLFFPYRAELSLYRIPLVTILICIVCILVFIAQQRNEARLFQAMESTCTVQAQEAREILKKLGLPVTEKRCKDLLYNIFRADSPEKFIQKLAVHGAQLSWLKGYKTNLLFRQQILQREISDFYQYFRQQAPLSHLTARLWYEPTSWNPAKMITAAFSHADWMHLLGNLFFFYVFAATVEIILGVLRFLFVVMVIAMGSFAVYSLSAIASSTLVPTLGLSGVVMGMMAMFAYFLPWAKIRCFFWFIIIIRTFTLPAWLLVAWYLGQDAIQLFRGEDTGGVNLVAHVSGALIGFLLGLLFFRQQKRIVQKELRSYR
jgi:membrane associated rhomboid family serine protease